MSTSSSDRPTARYIMASDLQGKHILDTSAWNALFKDPRRDELLEILGTKVILPTTLSISELAATEDPEKRLALIRLVKTVGKDNRPLAMPNQLMILACQGYARRDLTLTLSAGGEAEGAWIAINDPALINTEGQRLTLGFNKERETIFRNFNEGLRGTLQNNFEDGVVRPRSMSALIRHYNRNDNFLYNVVNPIYERATSKPLARNELRPLLGSLPYWPMFLLSYACAIYQRAVREEGFSHRRNPGNLDLWSAVYLPSCDTFVTNDTRQRRALKIINRSGPRLSRITSYREWTEELLRV